MSLELLTFDDDNTRTKDEVKKILTALPPYFGGKRKLFSEIINQFPKQSTVVDLMAGAHNIALASKASGHKVISNDRMYGPYIIGKAFIENSTHKIDINTIGELLLPHTQTYITDNFLDVHLPLHLCTIVDNIQGNIEDIRDNSVWVYRYLLYKFLTHIAPFNMFRYEAFVRHYNSGTKLSKSLQKYANGWDAAIADPLKILTKIAKQINNSVINGSGSCYNEDIDSFMNRGSMGDVLYFDPPYFGARVKYEHGYDIIDKMLSQDAAKTTNVSLFNNKVKERPQLLDVLTHASNNYELTIFSYWIKKHNREWFYELFEDAGLSFEEVPLVGYKYSLSGYIGGSGENSGTINEKVSNVEIMFKLKPTK